MRNIKIRKCIVCGKHRHKDELFRIVKNKSGDINLDFTGKLNGRGAYICKDRDCLVKSIKEKNLNRALKCNVPVEIYKKLETM